MSTGKILTLDELRGVLDTVKRNWEFIILHHSATPDGNFLSDFDAIKRFHMSYRLKGDIITKEKAEQLIAQGQRVILPWVDIAYHFILEYDGGKFVIKQGRDLETSGAHCVGMNGKGIGICVVGNYDVVEPTDEQLEIISNVCTELVCRFKIPVQNIKPHHFYAAWKSCPGNKFPWMKFAKQIIDKVG